MDRFRVGLIGCGNICDIYFDAEQKFPVLKFVACADIDHSRAVAKAAEREGVRAVSVDALIADPDIDVVLNLTIPNAHYSLSKAALNAGKHVHVEKPLSLTRKEGKDLLETAAVKGLRVGCAPDTFLGSGLQTCRRLIDEGAIGTPIAATGFMMGRGPAGWHPNPDFFYKPGAGPMFDMGPYYLTAMTTLLGPIKNVTGMAAISAPEIVIGRGERAGETITVETPTHVSGLIQFASGAIGSLTTSFDVWAHHMPNLEIHGTEGSLSLPDPNVFGGPVLLRTRDDKDWLDVPLTHAWSENSRGIGLADMAMAIAEGRPHRASGELAYHVLEAMHGFLQSSDEGRAYNMESTVTQPAALASDWKAVG